MCGNVRAYAHVCVHDIQVRCQPSAIAPWDLLKGPVVLLPPTGLQLLSQDGGDHGGQVALQVEGHEAQQAL